MIIKEVLYITTISGNEETLLLIKKKCDVDIQASNFTLIYRLFRLIRINDKEFIFELLTLKVNLNYKDIFNKSLL
jgi:hypothetical protein